MDAKSKFVEIVSGPDSKLNIEEAALLIACHDYPDLDVNYYLSKIDGIAMRLASRMVNIRSEVEKIEILNQGLFQEEGFSGNVTDYYDPKNSYLNDVIERRLGVPITLSMLYIGVGRRLGVDLDGISFPGHFLVRMNFEDGAMVIDPFSNGRPLSYEDLQSLVTSVYGTNEDLDRLLPMIMAPASKKATLVRMLRNLKKIYLKQEEPLKALNMSDLIVSVMPTRATEIRDRGLLYQHLDCPNKAYQDLQKYLALSPGAEDVDEIRDQIYKLRPALVSVH